jgi:hypothetical protein
VLVCCTTTNLVSSVLAEDLDVSGVQDSIPTLWASRVTFVAGVGIRLVLGSVLACSDLVENV